MLLPHAYHGLIVNGLKEDESSHLTHLFEGFFGTLVGMALIVYSKKHI